MGRRNYGHRHYIVNKPVQDEHPIRDFVWLVIGVIGYLFAYIILASQ